MEQLIFNGFQDRFSKTENQTSSYNGQHSHCNGNEKTEFTNSVTQVLSEVGVELVEMDHRHESRTVTAEGGSDVVVKKEVVDDDCNYDKKPDRGTGPCEMCSNQQSKYTCPRCELRTCCVACVKEHKIRSGCSGERNKCAFKDISEYSHGDMLNDYRFLEDAERRLFSNTAAPTSHRRQPVRWAPYHLSKRSKVLQDAAYKRGVSLRFVSPALSKSKANTSYFTIAADKIDWHIDWLFSSTNTLVKDERVSESTILVEVARKFTNFVEHPNLRKSLEDYKDSALDSSHFLLKVECLPANKTRYLELKPSLSLADNLKGVCLLEYPTIVVVPASNMEQFTILCKEDMTSMETAAARHILQHRPELNPSDGVENLLLDPTSDLYADLPSQNKNGSGRVLELGIKDERKMGRTDKIKALLNNLKSFSSNQ